MLRRNLYFAPRSVKTKAYFSCVRPILEYASTCWSPSSDKLNSTIEMVQHNAAKFVCNSYPKKGQYENFSITRLLDNLQWDTLEDRRDRAKLCMGFKILNSDVILPPDVLPRAVSSRPRSCNEPKVGSMNKLYEPRARLLTTNRTFYYSVPRLWNEKVTPAQAKAKNLDTFKDYFVTK